MKYLKLIAVLVAIISLLSACTTQAENPQVETTSEVEEVVSTEQITPTEYVSNSTTEPTLEQADYSACGSGNLVLTGFFKDEHGTISPTQILRVKATDDEVRTYAQVVTCLVHDEGWVSDPSEVINGYENVIIFYDIHGVAHQYRIIIGGEFVEPWEEGRMDIVSSLDGIEYKGFSVEKWIEITREHFTQTGVRQIGMDIYLDDTDEKRSEVFKITHNFANINHQIEQALLSGEGYPENVPDNYFLFATQSWLVVEE